MSKYLNFIYLQHISFLKYAYDDPCDVDLSVGSDMHEAATDSLLNDILDNIIAIQFSNLKCGDPYFYTNALNSGIIQ